MKNNKIRNNAFVVFDKNTCTTEMYNEYFSSTFEGKIFVFLGEIPQAHGHCMLVDLTTGLISGLWHTSNFREATEDEC